MRRRPVCSLAAVMDPEPATVRSGPHAREAHANLDAIAVLRNRRAGTAESGAMRATDRPAASASGWNRNFAADAALLGPVVQQLKKAVMRVSRFCDPDFGMAA